MMSVESLKQKIKENEKLKNVLHRLILNPKRVQPRIWVRLFVNPFFSKRGSGSLIKRGVILNVTPINRFALGRNSVIEFYSVIDNGVGDVIVGEESRIGIGSTLIGPVSIGSKVITAQNVVLSGLNHNYGNVDICIKQQGVSKMPIVVEDDVWIGANSVITAGVTIGTHSVIAGGSVVVKDVPPYSICAGVPSKVIKRYNFKLKSWVKAID